MDLIGAFALCLRYGIWTHSIDIYHIPLRSLGSLELKPMSFSQVGAKRAHARMSVAPTPNHLTIKGTP